MRFFLKKLAADLVLLVMLPIYLLYKISALLTGPSCFSGYSQFLSLFPGKTGSYLRIGFYRLAMKHCSYDCVIGFGTIFSQCDTEIEEGVYIGPQCNIGLCRIGKDSLIASGVHIMSGSNQHNFDDIDTPIQQQGGEFKKIEIGEDCWIGNGSLIMANTGKKSIIGAGSVVTKNVDSFSIVAGNPARVIKMRE